MAGRSLEIVCSACGTDSLVKRVPKYDGFKKVGETFACVSCGHEYESEDATPFKIKKASSIFGEEDRLKKVDLFTPDEKGKNCRYCQHYVVNPFTQRCGLNNRIVQATDVCEKFEKKPEENKAASGEGKEEAAPEE
jgi:hypothetical protein